MIGPRLRTEDRVRKSIASIHRIGEMSKYPNLLTPSEIGAITEALQSAVLEATAALRDNRDAINFRLSNNEESI